MTTQPNNPNEQLSAFLDGELSAAESGDLERRLASEPALRLELEELAEVKRLVGHLPRVQAPASIRSAIAEQLERRSLLQATDSAVQPRRWWFRWVRVLSAAAVLLIVSALGFIVWRQINPPAAAPTGPVAQVPTPVASPMGGSGGGGWANTESAGKEMTPPAGPLLLPPGPSLTMADLAKGNHLPEGLGPVGERSAAKPEIDRKDTGEGVGDASTNGDYSDKHEVTMARAELPAKVGGGSRPDARTRPVVASKGGFSVPLAARLRQGAITADEVRNHDYRAEALVIDVPVRDAEQQDQVTDELRKTAVEYGALNVEELNKDTALTAGDHQFFLEGKADKNYSPNGPNKRQIFARVPNDVAEKLFLQARKDSHGLAQVMVNKTQLADADEAKVAEQFEQLQYRAFAGGSSKPAGAGVAMGKTRADDVRPGSAGRGASAKVGSPAGKEDLSRDQFFGKAGSSGSGPSGGVAVLSTTTQRDTAMNQSPERGQGQPAPTVVVAPSLPPAGGPLPSPPRAAAPTASQPAAAKSDQRPNDAAIAQAPVQQQGGCPASQPASGERQSLNEPVAAAESGPADAPQTGQAASLQGPSRVEQAKLAQSRSAREELVDLVINVHVSRTEGLDRDKQIEVNPAESSPMSQPSGR